jgi:hypothetical protein
MNLKDLILKGHYGTTGGRGAQRSANPGPVGAGDIPDPDLFLQTPFLIPTGEGVIPEDLYSSGSDDEIAKAFLNMDGGGGHSSMMDKHTGFGQDPKGDLIGWYSDKEKYPAWELPEMKHRATQRDPEDVFAAHLSEGGSMQDAFRAAAIDMAREDALIEIASRSQFDDAVKRNLLRYGYGDGAPASAAEAHRTGRIEDYIDAEYEARRSAAKTGERDPGKKYMDYSTMKETTPPGYWEEGWIDYKRMIDERKNKRKQGR